MKNRRGLFLGAVLVCAAAAFIFLYRIPDAEKSKQGNEGIDKQSGSGLFSKVATRKAIEPKPQVTSGADASSVQALPGGKKIILTENNFEEFVAKCFQGNPCDFGENPWSLYQKFKRSQHPKVCDSIIAMMRRNLSDPAFKEKYKDMLLSMILDYYPTREIDFQTAAFYDYLGDHQKSLELYLALEKKQATNPDLRHAPALNIANVYYSLRKFEEARPYYRSALQELMRGPEKVSDQRSIIQFIQGRLEEIEKASVGK